MNTKLNIGIDIDDVTQEFVEPFTAFYNHVLNDNAPIPTSWDLTEHLPQLDDKQRLRSLANLYTQTGQFRTAPAVPHAVGVIRGLIEGGHNVSFITARNSRAISDTYRWFAEQGLPINNIYFDRDKAWHAERLGLDVMIDDGIHNLDAAAPFVKDRILYDRPWNRVQGTYAHWRVSSWLGIDEVLDSVLERKVDEVMEQQRLAL